MVLGTTYGSLAFPDDSTAKILNPIVILSMQRVVSSEREPQHTNDGFLLKLRDALVRVRFLYLSNHSIPKKVNNTVLEQADSFFNLSLEKNIEIDSGYSKHFLGYNAMNAVTGHDESLFVSKFFKEFEAI